MTDIGVMSGSERLPLVRTPTDGNNYSVQISALVALAGGTSLAPHGVDTRTTPQTVTLPTGNAALVPIYYDQYGNATANPITISGAAFPVSINMNYGSCPFFWSGSAWYPF